REGKASPESSIWVVIRGIKNPPKVERIRRCNTGRQIYDTPQITLKTTGRKQIRLGFIPSLVDAYVFRPDLP
ncbi:MAG: hypothetical protein AABZ64_13365, partial [Nitrospinota bacterium]